MKRFFLPLLATFFFLVGTQSKADVLWQGSADQFRYDAENFASFYYLDEHYYKTYNLQVTRDESSAPFCSVADTQINEFENMPLSGSRIDLEVMARGPDCNSSQESIKPNGIMVQAFLSTIGSLLDDKQGVDITQEATSWFTRRFEVDQEETHKIRADLITGTIDFDSFTVSEVYQAFYLLSAEVTLHQIVGIGDQMSIIRLPGFPVYLDETKRSATIDVQLKPFNEQNQKITYHIKSVLKLQSRISNFDQKTFFVEGDVNGNYQLGTSEDPLRLQAVIYQGSYVDSDEDGASDDLDNCPDSYNPDQMDNDEDGLGDVCDACPSDAAKTAPGICGCGVADTDSDADGALDCNDACPSDAAKTAPGICGCGVADTDSDDDGISNCFDADDDNDGMPDTWEETYHLNPLVNDADQDDDNDGYSNLREYKFDTDPTDPESVPKPQAMPWLQLLLD